MIYTTQTEARRRLSQSRTWYARLVEKNRQAEAEYREKIAQQERNLTGLQEAEKN